MLALSTSLLMQFVFGPLPEKDPCMFNLWLNQDGVKLGPRMPPNDIKIASG